MAEGFEPYHVPQQSRRDKLRAEPPSFHGLFMLPPPTYDHLKDNNLMCLVGSSSSSSIFRNPYSTPASDPQFHDHAFLYATTTAPDPKPEPLSLSLSSSFGVVPATDAALPLGPFTGYASVLKGSRFLRPAQQLLEEFCFDVVGGACADDKLSPDPALMSADGSDGVCDDDRASGVEIRKKKSRLISMLDEVYRRYKQYYQQMQAVVTSFEYVSGLGNAAPYANLAVKAMTRHFRCLKNAIMDQLQFAAKEVAHSGHRKDEAGIFRGSNNRGPYGQRPVSQGMGFLEHQPVWRPQRGLPERAVSVLRAWLFEHFLHPYPTDTDKLMLAKQTGLSRSQVSNWFINARVRLWKPMVEEIHMLETRQAQKGSQQRDHMPPATTENPSTSTSKRTRSELPNAASNDVSLSYDGQLASHLHAGAVSVAGGVSLTLGLHHQNNHGNGNIVLSEPFPMDAAQRFGLGLEGSGDGFLMNTFEAQNRHFARDVLGGQLLHDFVG